MLVRGAIPDFRNPLAPDELAGLATEDGVESRLVIARGEREWELHEGPFEADELTHRTRAERSWSLLVQEVDTHVPAVAALLERFRFVPNWRIDDVMVSYAPTGGSVGAHVDSYDVFLLQGLGRRRWSIREQPLDAAEASRTIPQSDLPVLEKFEPDAEWVLTPGDMLYLPPGVAHHGVALDDCMTYSIGFHAPRTRDVLVAVLPELAAGVDADRRYADPDLAACEEPGEIGAAVRDRFRELVRLELDDDQRFDTWLGRFLTEPRRGPGPPHAERPTRPDELRDAVKRGAVLERWTVAQLAYIDREDGSRVLFASGEAYPLDVELAYAAPLVTGRARLDRETLGARLGDARLVELLTALVDRGALIVTDGDDRDAR